MVEAHFDGPSPIDGPVGGVVNGSAGAQSNECITLWANKMHWFFLMLNWKGASVQPIRFGVDGFKWIYGFDQHQVHFGNVTMNYELIRVCIVLLRFGLSMVRPPHSSLPSKLSFNFQILFDQLWSMAPTSPPLQYSPLFSSEVGNDSTSTKKKWYEQ